QHDRDVLALADALGRETIGDPGDHRVDLAVRQFTLVELEKHLGTMRSRPSPEHGADHQAVQRLAPHPHPPFGFPKAFEAGSASSIRPRVAPSWLPPDRSGHTTSSVEWWHHIEARSPGREVRNTPGPGIRARRGHGAAVVNRITPFSAGDSVRRRSTP